MRHDPLTRIWGLLALAAVLGVIVAVLLIDRLPADAGVADRLSEIDLRLLELERRAVAVEEVPAPRLASRTAVRVVEVPDEEAPPPQDPAPPEPPVQPTAAEIDALFGGLERYLGQRATPAEQEHLFATLRDGRTVPALLQGLEAAVEADPDDLEGRMRLAQGYLAKLFTVPPGPEMGVWGSKAEEQWEEVLARDDHHWEARYRLGTNYAFYPEMLNKTEDAICEFETLRRQQEEGLPESKQANVYVMLATLYRRQGDAARAAAVLEAARARHPDHPAVEKAMGGRR